VGFGARPKCEENASRSRHTRAGRHQAEIPMSEGRRAEVL
jgi:hypothetical protein